MKTQRKPRAPAHLAAETRAWFASVQRDYVLEEHHIRLLTLAAEAFDRCNQARDIVARDGLTLSTGDGGQKAHPAIGIERDSRLAFARILRELDLDTEAPIAGRRGPPALRSNRGGA
jgi:P27 family predicted phage terminase small subunit